MYVGVSQLNYGNRFWYLGQLWQHCGWYSAVNHICGLCLQTGEKRIISHVSRVEIFEEEFLGGLGI